MTSDFDKALGTSFGDAEMDSMMELVQAACTMPDPASEPRSLSNARMKAIHTTLQRAAYYRKQDIRTDVVHMAIEKRLNLIANAATVAELKEISAEPRPRHTGSGLVSGRFSVPEEELIVWSITSMHGPMIPAGIERYAYLFRQVFGFAPGKD